MDFSFAVILEAILLALSLSMDAFVASFAYGSNKIKMPMLSVQIINLICTSFFGITLLIGSLVKQFIPRRLAIGICFSILLILGIIKLLDSATKSIIRKYSKINKEIKFSIFNFKFILNLYADAEKADLDSSKVISPKEAVSIAIALSLDGIAVGFGAAFGSVNILVLLLFSLISGMGAIMLGCFVGNKIARKIPFNLSWLSGILLIGLAITKLI